METSQATLALPQFNQIYDRLNASQRAAVDALDGPVMVVAGPGTGKTEMLAMRVANLVMQGLAQPSDILCLTFTDAGVQSMRRRLLGIMGPMAHEVGVYTFHSFCNEIIQDNLNQLGLPAGMQPISDLELHRLMRDLVEALHDKHPLRRVSGDLYAEAKHLHILFSTIKNENFEVEAIKKALAAYFIQIPTLKEFTYQVNRGNKKIGDLKKTGNDERDRMERLGWALELYPEYCERLHNLNRYEFADMINWVLEAFANKPQLLDAYRERYLYFLVDEFQDTNGLQNRLLYHLVDDPIDHKPNIFVVGDDDQAIFRFQGARIENMLELYLKYAENFQVFCLETNYRSTQAILDSAARLIQLNTERMVANPEVRERLPNLQKNLRAYANNRTHPSYPQPSVTEYKTLADENLGVFQQIRLLIQEKGVEPHDIAVLYRKHQQVADLFKMFQQSQLPASLKRDTNLLETPHMRNLCELLAYLDEESRHPGHGEHRLARLLFLEWWGLERRTLDYFFALYTLERNRSFGLDGTTEIRRTLLGLLLEGGQLGVLPETETVKVKALAATLIEWMKAVHQMAIVPFIQRIMHECGLMRQMVESPDALSRLQQIKQFLHFVEDEAIRHLRAIHPNTPPTLSIEGLSLQQLMQVLNEMEKANIILKATVVMGDANGVKFLTAHGSKGLEFEHVFLIGCDNDTWQFKKLRKDFYRLPPPIVRASESANYEDERRLFYVACTRAKHQLWLSYATRGTKGKEIQRAKQIDEMFLGLAPSDDLFTISDNYHAEAIAYLKQVMSPLPENPILADQAYLAQLIADYQLSPSGLNTWLECRRKFYYEALLRLPTRPSARASLGTAVHLALNDFFTDWQRAGEMPSEQTLNNLYIKRLEQFRGHFTTFEYRSYAAWTDKLLPGYYDYFKHLWTPNARLEYSFRNMQIEGVPVNGRVDKLEMTQGGIMMVDYKSGELRAYTKTISPPCDEQPNGGKNWRQMTFYGLLVKQGAANLGLPPLGGYFEFVVPDKEGNYGRSTVPLQDDDLNFMRNLIAEVFREIKDLTYDLVVNAKGPEAGICGECDWCKLHNPYAFEPETATEAAETVPC